MTKNEVVDLFRMICLLFPYSAKYYANADAFSRDTWHSMLEDEPAEMVAMALKKHAATNKWAPAIAEILETIGRIKYPETYIDPDEAWGMVMHAVRKFGYYHPEEAFASLPSIVASTVRTYGWRDLCLSENLGVDRGQFRKAYEVRLLREREKATMPEKLQRELATISARMNLRILEEGADLLAEV